MGDGDERIHHIDATESSSDVFDVRNVAGKPIRTFDAIRDHSIRGDARCATNNALVSYGKQHREILHLEHFHKSVDAGGHIAYVFRMSFSASVPSRCGPRHFDGAPYATASYPTAHSQYGKIGFARDRHCFGIACRCRLFRPNAVANRSTMECSQGMHSVSLSFSYSKVDINNGSVFISGIQLLQRSVYGETRNDINLRLSSSFWFTIWIDIVCTARSKVQRFRIRCGAPSVNEIFFFLPLNISRCNTRLELKWSVPVVIALIIGNSILCSNIPRWNGFVIFYGCGFAANLMFVVALLVIVPYLGNRNRPE